MLSVLQAEAPNLFGDYEFVPLPDGTPAPPGRTSRRSDDGGRPPSRPSNHRLTFAQTMPAAPRPATPRYGATPVPVAGALASCTLARHIFCIFAQVLGHLRCRSWRIPVRLRLRHRPLERPPAIPDAICDVGRACPVHPRRAMHEQRMAGWIRHDIGGLIKLRECAASIPRHGNTQDLNTFLPGNPLLLLLFRRIRLIAEKRQDRLQFVLADDVGEWTGLAVSRTVETFGLTSANRFGHT